MELKDVLAALDALPANKRKELEDLAMSATAGMKIIPNLGQQAKAYYCKADVIGYGGAGGGGKSYLTLAKAINPDAKHLRSIVFRRESTQADGLIDNAKTVIGQDARYNGTDLEFSWPDGRSLKFAGLPNPDDWRKHAGRERDLMVFDEAAEFLEDQVASLFAWNRGPTGVHCQVILPSNPPRSSDGAWYLEWFAPWLDRNYPTPAEDGEIRWCVYQNGKTIWVDGPEPVNVGGEVIKPKSRTFIHAKLSDNPFRDTPEYRASLQALPGVLSRQMLHGDFEAGAEDDEWQIIPTAWVRAAQARWTERAPVGIPMCAMGCDIAQGGADDTVIAARRDGWFAPLSVIPGVDTPDGHSAAAEIIKRRRDNADVIVDLGGGWGGDALQSLTTNGIPATGYMGIKPATMRSRDGKYTFFNRRTQAYWQFREALDPSQEGGSPIALPPDNYLVQELCAVTYSIVPQGIKALSKEEVKKKIGRSPDRADAVTMCWQSMTSSYLRSHGIGANKPKINLGHSKMKRHNR